MIDFHSHLLPGVDDGSKTLQESLEMLRMEQEQGISHVVATPHFYARYDKPEEFLRRRDQAEAKLRSAMESYEDLPMLLIGAEVYYFRGISDCDFLPQLTIKGTSCVMIEMPHAPWPEAAFQELQQIYRKWGIVPVIAHVDRYIGPLQTHGIPEKLAKLPVLVQANADFFLKRHTAGLAKRMLKGDRIHLLGSDCHNTVSRKPNLGDAIETIEKRLGQDVIDRVRRYSADALRIDR